MKKNRLLVIIFAIVILLQAMTGCQTKSKKSNNSTTTALLTPSITSSSATKSPSATDTPTSTDDLSGETLKVHYIDVGQGDSILIQQGEYNMLIDAGENNKGTVVTKYLNSINVDTLDYVVGTHPHSDHIGGLDTVINSVETKTAIIPDVTHTTKTYEDFIDSLLDNEVDAYPAAVGDTYTLGKAEFKILAPNAEKYKSMNDYSVVIKLTFGNNSFLFCGDAEKLSESEILATGNDIKSDVIKLGHHGSSTSSSESFIKEVSAKYAIICCGKDNSYGHPHRETVNMINKYNIESYRTDICGTIIAECDGTNISFSTEK